MLAIIFRPCGFAGVSTGIPVTHESGGGMIVNRSGNRSGPYPGQLPCRASLPASLPPGDDGQDVRVPCSTGMCENGRTYVPAGRRSRNPCLPRRTYAVHGCTSVARGQEARSDRPCRQKKRPPGGSPGIQSQCPLLAVEHDVVDRRHDFVIAAVHAQALRRHGVQTVDGIGHE